VQSPQQFNRLHVVFGHEDIVIKLADVIAQQARLIGAQRCKAGAQRAFDDVKHLLASVGAMATRACCDAQRLARPPPDQFSL
jgi:hypothetical protein